MSNDAVDRARSLIGTRFRAQGRDPQLGLDCLGLAMIAHCIDGAKIRRDYRLSGDHRRELMAGLASGFRRVPPSQQRAGDLMLIRVATDQYHLAVRTPAGFVHADARRGVVETPGPPAWSVVATYRRRVRAIRGNS
ncbi:MAG: peptidoglycan endopeptidase [Blastocatellia bacterium]|nr:peptidoglycan endopeptidase [Blastocatellia bacterium]